MSNYAKTTTYTPDKYPPHVRAMVLFRAAADVCHDDPARAKQFAFKALQALEEEAERG